MLIEYLEKGHDACMIQTQSRVVPDKSHGSLPLIPRSWARVRVLPLPGERCRVQPMHTLKA